MRVLLAPAGSRGDVQPQVALARTLRERGHHVRFSAPRDFEPWIRRERFEFAPVDIDVHAMTQELGDRIRNPFSFLLAGGRAAPALVAAMERDCRDVDVVIGAGVQGAAATVCEARGIRYLYAVYCPLTLPSAKHPPMSALGLQSMPAWANAALWRFQELAFDRVFGPPRRALRRKLGLPKSDVGTYHAFAMAPAGTLAAFDTAIAPAPADWPPYVSVTGAWTLPDGAALPVELARFLDAPGPPAVFVGFGSMPVSDPEHWTRMIVDAIDRAGVRGVIGSGWAGIGGGARTKRVFVAEGSVPHRALFERVAAIVHHGGAGTTATAARAGKPQVVVPHLLDQFYWAHRVTALGVGPSSLPAGKVGAARLAAAIRAAIDRRHHADNARTLAARLPVDGLARAVERIETS